MIIRVVIPSLPVRVLQSSKDRLVSYTLLNAGTVPVEIVSGPTATRGSGFVLVPGAELNDECSGTAELWAMADGAERGLIVGTRMIIEKAAQGWSFKGPVDDMTIARLPFPEAQNLLRAPAVGAGRLVGCEWHGPQPPLGDPERTSFAIVNDEGPYVDLIGERLRLTYRGHVVYVYVHRSGQLDTDISLTRRAFMALAPLSVTEIHAEMRVVG